MTQAERERCARIEAALRDALFTIRSGGVRAIGEREYYDPIIVAKDVERWQAALAPTEERK